MGGVPEMLAHRVGLGTLWLMSQVGVPGALLARCWHSMLGLHPSSVKTSISLAGEWKK